MDRGGKEKASLCHLELKGEEKIRGRFEEIDYEAESYFIPKKEGNYLMEYDFESLPQLKEQLMSLWKDEEDMQTVIQIVLAASMKNKPLKVYQEEWKDKHGKNVECEIPEFIYNF